MPQIIWTILINYAFVNNSIQYKRSFVKLNPQSNTDFTQVTCVPLFYYTVKLGYNKLGYNELPVKRNKSFPLFLSKIYDYYNNELGYNEFGL